MIVCDGKCSSNISKYKPIFGPKCSKCSQNAITYSYSSRTPLCAYVCMCEHRIWGKSKQRYEKVFELANFSRRFLQKSEELFVIYRNRGS